MLTASIEMLRARREEQVALTGVLLALFPDDPSEAVRRLESVRDSARECASICTRAESRRKRTCMNVAALADDMLLWVGSLASRFA